MHKISMLIICFGLVLAIAGCNSANITSSKEIYVPILADEAWLKADGAFLNGVNLAFDELNSQHSDSEYSVRTAVIDDGALYEKGVEMATKLSQDETVTAVLNLQNFDVTKTTASILSESGKIVMFPYGAYDSLFQANDPYHFCPVASFSDLGKTMANYVLNKGYKRIAVYHNGKQSQEELVIAFELALLNSESKVVDYIPSISSKSEFEETYGRWNALGVDCILIAQYGLDEAFDVLKIIRSKDQNMPIIGEPIFNRANALEENTAVAEGMAVPSTLVIEESENLKMFEEKYRQRYLKEADIWAVQGYDMLRLIVDTAVRLNTNDSSEIAEALHSESGYKGIGRHIAFNKGGDMVVDINKLPMLKCFEGRFK